MDPYKGEVLSIGLVKLSGEELYLELEYEGQVSSWVKKNIIPTLKDKKVSRKKAISKIKKLKQSRLFNSLHRNASVFGFIIYAGVIASGIILANGT